MARIGQEAADLRIMDKRIQDDVAVRADGYICSERRGNRV